MKTQTHVYSGHGDGGRDWGPPRITSNTEARRKLWNRLSLGAARGNNPADSLISGVSPPKWERVHWSCFKSPSLCYLVTAVLGNRYPVLPASSLGTMQVEAPQCELQRGGPCSLHSGSRGDLLSTSSNVFSIVSLVLLWRQGNHFRLQITHFPYLAGQGKPD